MAFTTNDSDSAFLAAFAVAQEFQLDAADSSQTLLLEQALWGDDDDENGDDDGDELMPNDDELLMIPELMASDDARSDSASAQPPTDHTQYPQMQVASLPNRRNLARRSRKKMFKYKPNRARDGRREELVYLSKKVSELETQLETLKRRQQGANAAGESEITMVQHQQDSSETLAIKNASHNSAATGVWREIASRQSEERSKAEKDNIRLKLVLEHQIKIAKSLEGVLHKKLSTKVRQLIIRLSVQV